MNSAAATGATPSVGVSRATVKMEADDEDAQDQRQMQKQVMAASVAASAAGTPLGGLPALPGMLSTAPSSAAAAAAAAAAAFPMTNFLPPLPLPNIGHIPGLPFSTGLPNLSGGLSFPTAPMSLLSQEQMMAQMTAWYAQNMGSAMVGGAVGAASAAAAQAAAAQSAQAKKPATKKKESPLAATSGLNFSATMLTPSIVPLKQLRPTDSLLMSLHSELQLNVFSYLEGRDIATLSRASKYMHTQTSHPRVWKLVCSRMAMYPCEQHSHPWKELYLTRMAKVRSNSTLALECVSCRVAPACSPFLRRCCCCV